MDGYTAYQLYQALKLHFSSPTYDYFKYHGHIKGTVEHFERRNDRYFFHKLARQYPDQQDLIFFFASNFFRRKVNWVRELMTEEGKSTYMEAKRIKECWGYSLTQDIEKILENYPDFKSALKVTEGEYPPLLVGMNQGDIQAETVIALNLVIGFLPVWSKKISDTILFPATKMKLDRYAPFLTINPKSVLNILKTKIEISS